MSRVLIVEDEEHLAAGLRFNLEAEGYDAVVAGSGEDAIEKLLAANRFDLVVLDVMLPGIDGFEVVKRLREAGNYMPVLLLTARGQAEDVLRGLSAGADDYLPKPFDLEILVARIQGLLRRKEWARKQESEGQAEPAEYAFGDNRLDFQRQLIARNGAEQPLTLMELNLLRHFIRNEGKNVSRKALLEEVWGVREDTDTRAIDNFVVRLRRYIEDDPAKPKHLLTVRGVGYRFVAEPA
ncbi:MAG: response regulator transcription factor, partial [Acidobacteria bacterium]|nr:response regulator transcription factor [Acidobacteriota bacterium]